MPLSMLNQPTQPSAVRGAVAGFVGGLVGTWVMSEFQAAWSRARHGRELRSVPYLFGSAMGAVYGALWESSENVRGIGGVGWGMAVWAGADELAIPALRLSAPAANRPAERHLHALASYMVYGATVEGVRRLTRRALAAV